MTSKEKIGVRRMIYATINHLERASLGRKHMGSRYSRLLHMLWRVTPMEQNNGRVANVEAQYGAFSWLDLDAIRNFATMYNSNIPASAVDDFDSFSGDIHNLATTTLFTDYRWLSDDNSNMIF